MDNWADAVVANQRALFTLHVGQSAIIALGVASVMLRAGTDVMAHRLSVGDLVLINAYVIQICLPLNALGFVYREARDALINAEKLFQLLREKPEISEPPGLPPLAVSQGEVVFDHVSFAYEPNRPILHDVSLRIPPGKTVAVVGGSGSGKSTLARLLLRFYDVGSGRITVDGQDIRSISTRSLREAIGVVPQDTLLFNDTIAYNIAYGRDDATEQDVIAAAKTNGSIRCHRSTRRRSANAASSCRAAKSSASRWRARS
jgi:ATP-binding cassette subfamily B protein